MRERPLLTGLLQPPPGDAAALAALRVGAARAIGVALVGAVVVGEEEPFVAAHGAFGLVGLGVVGLDAAAGFGGACGENGKGQRGYGEPCCAVGRRDHGWPP